MSIRPNTTCDIYRAGNAPPLTPDVAAVPCCLISCFDVGRERGEKEAQQYRFTAKMLVSMSTDVRDDFNAWTGSASNRDIVCIPDKTATAYNVTFVERINRGLAGDALCVYLDRLAVVWPFPGPVVIEVNPDCGLPAGGTTVTITGRSFTGATVVDFAANSATFAVNSSTQITAISPAGTGTVDITVTTPLGVTPLTPADKFTYTTPYSLTFMGLSQQYVDVGNVAVLQFTSPPFSVSAWVDSQGGGVAPLAIAGVYGASGQSYLLYGNSSGYYAFEIVCGGPAVAQGGAPGANTDHVVGTWDGTTVKLYVNGVLVDSQPCTGTMLASTQSFQIGAENGPGGGFWGGTIDAVRVYNIALTLAQVQEIYGNGNGDASAGSASANLVGWWKFDEGSGTTALDSSGQGNNGTLVNSPTYTSATILG